MLQSANHSQLYLKDLGKRIILFLHFTPSLSYLCSLVYQSQNILLSAQVCLLCQDSLAAQGLLHGPLAWLSSAKRKEESSLHATHGSAL